jgi:hypothetical protein
MPGQSPGSNNDEEDDDDSSTCAPGDYNSHVVPETQLPTQHILLPFPVRHPSQQRYPLRSTPDRQQQQAPRYIFVNDRNRSSSSHSGPPTVTSAAVNNTITATTSSGTNNNITTTATTSKIHDTTTNASVTSNTMKTNSKSQPPSRTKGSKNYSHNESEDLLKSVSISLPLGSEDWQIVLRMHNVKYSSHDCNAVKLKRIFFELANKKPTTGNPEQLRRR